MMERNLLLVDDEENILRALTRLLRRDGYRILTANSGQEGLTLLEENAVGVIISDQRMPEMSGVEFLGKVKERYPDTVRIVLSGYTDLNSVTDAINQGAIYKFLTKPWDDELLRKNVQKAFHYYELSSENQRLTEALRKANDLLVCDKRALEQRVQEKAEELEFNVGVLRIAQTVLERLPVAVLGIGDDGIIAIANHKAQDLLATGNGGLVGYPAEGVLSQEMLQLGMKVNETGFQQSRSLTLGCGSLVEVYCCRMDGEFHGRGTIVVLIEKGR